MIREILESIKEVVLDYVKHRLFPITVIIFVLFFILIRRLFILQIIEGEEHMDNFIYQSERTLTIESVRGNILDRNGKILAYNELSYSVTFSNDPNMANVASELGIDENTLKNQVVYETIKILESNGDELSVDFPIEISESGEYRFTVQDGARRVFLRNVYGETNFDNLTDDQKNATADDIMKFLCERRFNLSEEYSKEDALKIIACRYKLWLNRFQQYMPVTIAYDISERSNAAIMEHKDELYGMDVVVKSLRRYNDAKYFAHIIGYIGGISEDEMAAYNAELPDENKYSGTEMVGKTGIEQYCEQELRGMTGFETMYVNNMGKIIETIETKPAAAGNDVYLTIDADLQKYCYDTLEREIATILLVNLTSMAEVSEISNAAIPITDVYFGLFNNNYISIDKMGALDASPMEKDIYNRFSTKKEETLSRIDIILTVDQPPLYELSSEYQDYMEYICEALSRNDIFDTSMISSSDSEFIAYTSSQTSLAHYLKYAISVEAIDISSIEAVSDYYDTDEIYDLLCEYIINYLSLDPEFDKQVTKVMIKSGEISGNEVIELLYSQGVLNADGDADYAEYKRGGFSAYEFMVRKIEKLEITPAMLALDPCSGSIVVTDVNTGEVLAMVSYPSYDNNYLTNEVDAAYYNRLLNDKTRPLYNRATQQRTAPGSTYKIVTAVAALSEGVINQDTYFTCTGEFDLLEPAPKCWVYPDAHWGLNVVGAISNSCNVFFYQTGYNLSLTAGGEPSDNHGLETLAKYATMFGLNDLSGVEIPEISPNISNNDAVRSAIGQGRNSYAPVQLARYVTTVANSGTCYNLTLIDKVTDYEGNLIYENEAEVLNRVEVSAGTWDLVHTGMRRVISEHSPGAQLINNLNVRVAGKTGTAQESDVRPDHALFISYAPYENPEVSVTCVIQNGYRSGNAKELAGLVYAYMYDPEKLNSAEISGNVTGSD